MRKMLFLFFLSILVCFNLFAEKFDREELKNINWDWDPPQNEKNGTNKGDRRGTLYDIIGWQKNYSTTPFIIGFWEDPCGEEYRIGAISDYKIKGGIKEFNNQEYYDNYDYMKEHSDFPLPCYCEGKKYNKKFEGTYRVILWKGDYAENTFTYLYDDDPDKPKLYNGTEIGFYKFKRTLFDFYVGAYYRPCHCKLTAIQLILVNEETNEIVVQGAGKKEFWLARYKGSETGRVGWDYDKLTLYFRVKNIYGNIWMKWQGDNSSGIVPYYDPDKNVFF